jgi:hypothetical protein
LSSPRKKGGENKQRLGGVVRRRHPKRKGGHRGRQEEAQSTSSGGYDHDRLQPRQQWEGGRFRHRERLPTDHLKRLLKEACPNHAYPIRHKLKDCDMMMSFMTSGFPTWGTGLDEDPGGSDMMHFPRENTVMMVCEGRPPLGRCHVSKQSPRPPTHCGWAHGGTGV